MHPQSSLSPSVRRPLTAADAVDIWIARWLRVRRKDLCRRYGCDPRRLYEIWEERRFPASRDRARELFHQNFPWLADRIDFGPHRTISRASHPDQLVLFAEGSPVRSAAAPVRMEPRHSGPCE